MSLKEGKPVLQYDPSRNPPVKEPLKYTWQLGPIVFKVLHGDIFTVPTDAIVNSEQTDFQLGSDPSSISGKLVRSFHGRHIQRSLDRQMGGRVQLDLGTILKTPGGDICKTIYHAGFHHPQEWSWAGGHIISTINNPVLEEESNPEDRATDHLAVIRECIRKILHLAFNDDSIQSVAFPLIGTGVFDLNRGLVANDFFREVIRFALQIDSAANYVPPETSTSTSAAVNAGKDMEVCLVLYQESSFHECIESGVQAWLALTSSSLMFGHQQWEPLQLGVPFLDQFEEQLIKETHPKFSAWMHVRFAELILGYAVAVLAKRTEVAPMKAVGRGRPITFGGMRHMAKRLTGDGESQHTSLQSNDQDSCNDTFEDSVRHCRWHDFLISILCHGVQNKTLESINYDRNSIAHGRQSRPARDIRRDICNLLHLSAWKELCQEHQPPLDLYPWVACQPEAETTANAVTTEAANRTSVGVFEKWTHESICYIVPWSGSHFEVNLPDSL